jgi:hypothetical protein
MNVRHLLLTMYPRWWRERYGAEFQAMLGQVQLSPRAVLDILADAFDARLQPSRPPTQITEPPIREAAPQPRSPESRVRRRGLGPIEHELGIDRVIREAIERGDFDDLPGRGKPLDLSTYDLSNEWRLAYDVVKQAGETLPWIALGNEIEQFRDRLKHQLQLAGRESARYLGEDARRRRRAAYLEDLRRLDGLIDSYNNQVPLVTLQQVRMPEHVAEQRFNTVWPHSHPK